jgi:hypothetical protein
VAGNGFERPESIQRRKASYHRISSLINLYRRRIIYHLLQRNKPGRNGSILTFKVIEINDKSITGSVPV